MTDEQLVHALEDLLARMALLTAHCPDPIELSAMVTFEIGRAHV